MSRKKRAVGKPGVYHHIYQRSLDKKVVFHNAVDAIFFITTYRKYSLEYGVSTLALCLMRNHYHALVAMENPSKLRDFVREYSSTFVLGYNKFHDRKGQLFQRPFGCAPKKGSKKMRTCISYINNNPVEAGIKPHMEQYIWNLFAYMEHSYPFSEQLVLKRATKHMRRSLQEVSCYAKTNAILYPKHLECMMRNFSLIEKCQFRDYILKRYSPLDSEKLKTVFGSIANMVTALHSFMGSEYDIKIDDTN